MAPFEVVAALWDEAIKQNRLMSLSNWLKSESILIIGSSPANRANLDPINRALMKRLFDLLLDSKNTSDSITWVFLDEVREAGKLEGLSSLLNQGRSKGVSVVLGFQEIEGMVEEYGENVAGEIFGQCGHKTFLRTGSPHTANWIQQYWGERELMEVSFSSGISRGNGSTTRTETVSYGKQIRPAVLGSTVMQFPPTGPRSGVLAALHDIPGWGVVEQTEVWADIAALVKADDDRKAKAGAEKSDECPWPDKGIDFELVKEWGPDDTARISPPKATKAKEKKAEANENEEKEKKEGELVNGDLALTPGLTPGKPEESKEQNKKISNKLSRDRFL